MLEELQRAQDRIAKIATEVMGEAPRDPDAALELDSLGRAELALALEDEFGVRFDDAEELRSITGAVDAVRRRQGRPPGPAVIDPVSLRGWLQPVAKTVGGRILRRYFRVEVTGAEHVPRIGPAILCSNHESGWDMPLLVIAAPQRIVFMAKVELFAKRFPEWSLVRLGGFRVRRQVADVHALRTALEVVRRGLVLGMYPEGTRAPGKLLPFLPGAAWVGLAEGVPLIPVGMGTTATADGRKIPRREKVRIAFGEPIEVEREPNPAARLEKARTITAVLLGRVEDLLA